VKTKPQLDSVPRGFLEGLRFDPLPGVGLKGDLPGIGIDVLAPDDVGGDRCGEAVGVDFPGERLGSGPTVAFAPTASSSDFFGTLKYEHLYRAPIDDGGALAMETARFRDIYNRIRPHQALDDRTPRQAYLAT